ncbi:WD40/YVTN/BNR-like repeat-containing protein [Legionella genomosp. 1]|uniref:WD40/YVTN/BNR-like repeat-containing protein n=1 Tax=Legionella genomosp. 1 TaxID=1093625 RepID=UPI001055D4E1|nr:hypothetical protein [Legionella genomosp. 1]
MKKVLTLIGFLIAGLCSQSCLAIPGLFFNIAASGETATVNITLCLNGVAPLSCQNYNVSALSLSIATTVPNHLYPSAGIKINTPGFSLANLGLECRLIANGYCIFSVSNLNPVRITLKNNNTPPPPPPPVPPQALTVGGNVNGLASGSSLVLQNNGSDPLFINANGLFTFPAVLSAGTPYAVTVRAQPATQICTVSNGIGTISNTAVTNVVVSCSSFVKTFRAVGRRLVGGIAAPVAYSSSDNGNTWTGGGLIPVNDSVLLLTSLEDVACDLPGQTCVAVGQIGNSMNTSSASMGYYVSPATADIWQPSAFNTTPPGTGYILSSPACDGQIIDCLTVGKYAPQINPLTTAPLSLSSINGGDDWNQTATQAIASNNLDGLNGVACDAATGLHCIAVGSSQAVTPSTTISPVSYVTLDGAATWSSANIFPSNGQLNSIACDTSAMRCIAAGFSIQPSGMGTDNFPMAFLTVDGGTSWNSLTLPLIAGIVLNGVSCDVTGQLCSTVGTQTISGSSSIPVGFTTSNGGASWTASSFFGGNVVSLSVLNDVACYADGIHCVALGTNGNNTALAYHTVDGGISWIAAAIPPQIPAGSIGVNIQGAA